MIPRSQKSFLKEVFDKVSSAVGTLSNPLTPQKPEGAHNDANLDTNSETPETSMVNDDQVPPSSSKTYTQHDLDKLRTHWEEQFKLQKAIDKTILEKELQNHYLHQIQMLQQRLQLLEGANQTQANVATPPFNPSANHNLLYNQSLVHNSLVNMIDKSLNMQTTMLKQVSASAKEHYISSAKTYDGKDCKEFSNWLESVYRLSRISGKDLIEVALATSTGPLHKHISELMALGIILGCYQKQSTRKIF